jgi:hypothetical protein
VLQKERHFREKENDANAAAQPLNFDYFSPAADSGMTGMGFLSSNRRPPRQSAFPRTCKEQSTFPPSFSLADSQSRVCRCLKLQYQLPLYRNEAWIVIAIGDYALAPRAKASPIKFSTLSPS